MSLEMILFGVLGLMGITSAAVMPFVLDYRFQKRREEIEELHVKYTKQIADDRSHFMDKLDEIVSKKDKTMQDIYRTFGEMLLSKSVMDWSSAKEKIIKAEKGESGPGEAVTSKFPFHDIPGIRKALKDRIANFTPFATPRPGADPEVDKARMERRVKELEEELTVNK